MAFTVVYPALSFFVTEQVPVLDRCTENGQQYPVLFPVAAVPFFVLAGNLMNEKQVLPPA